ncbi:MAG: hypoxanthine phosphoribosyltransferase [Fimbriimonadaceae bacterium]|nr:hypoxanthine phosphoribosyltransferase [Fimbriimonadaceae bacterium]
MPTLDALLSEDQIQAKIDELAARLRADYSGESILLVAILKGSFVFVADLCRRLGEDIEVDFVQVSSYGDEHRSSGVVKFKKDADTSFEGRNVLLVEDIVDTGRTLAHLRELFGTRRPKSLRVVALLSKPEARAVPVEVEYVGFDIPNEYVVGYGLDSAERYRNLRYVAVLRESPTP